jgi:hypothetical protein
VVSINNQTWKLLKRESFGVEKITILSKSIKNRKKDRFIEFKVHNDLFRINYCVIYDLNNKFIVYKYIKSITINNHEILKSRNLIIPQKINISYDDLLIRISKCVFPTMRQHFIDQAFLTGWKNIHNYNYDNKGLIKQRKHSIFYKKNLYTILKDNRIYYFEDGLVKILEDKFNTALVNIRKNNKQEDNITNIINGCSFMNFRKPSVFPNKIDFLFNILKKNTINNKVHIGELEDSLHSIFYKKFENRLTASVNQQQTDGKDIVVKYIDLLKFKNLKNIKLPLTDNFSCFHMTDSIAHNNLDFDFYFFPISSHEFIIFFAKEFKKNVNKSMTKEGILNIIDFYSSFSSADLGSFIVSGNNMPYYNHKNMNANTEEMLNFIKNDTFFSYY